MFVEMQLVVQLALGIVFAFSTVAKLRDPTSFARGVADYHILTASAAYPVGLLIICLEGWLAIAHLTGWLLAVAVPLGFAMVASFTVAVAVNIERGRALPCYCFGSRSGERISGRTVARLLLLLSCEALLLANHDLFTANHVVFPQQVTGLLEFGFALFWATFLLVVGSWLLSLPDLVLLLRPRKTGEEQAAENAWLPGP